MAPLAGLAGAAGGLASGAAGAVGGLASGALKMVGGAGGLGKIANIAGTGLSMLGSKQSGDTAEQIGKQRAAIYRLQADQVRENSRIEKEILTEKFRKLSATQKNTAAASGIRINVGSPLVIESKTREDYAKDIGYITQRANQNIDVLNRSASLEEYMGKQQKSGSMWDMFGTGIGGMGSLANMGMFNFLGSGTSRLAGNQDMIKSAGGLSSVAKSSLISDWMSK